MHEIDTKLIYQKWRSSYLATLNLESLDRPLCCSQQAPIIHDIH